MAAAEGRFAQVNRGLKLTKSERKILKKQNKAFHTLRNRTREVGEISEVPTPYLLVKNGGLMCGVKRQDLVNVFNQYGKLDDLVMIPGKSFSYVLFSDIASAEEAMANVNGQKLVNQTTHRTFYLAYLLKRPCAELCLSDTSYPTGLILIKDFISEHEEHELLKYFSSSKETVTCRENNGVPGMKRRSGARFFYHC
jgi:alkylated DNA repair protein alkB family protein 8